jgi:cytidylate kinase
MTEKACKAVLISRQMGSGGSYIGHLVAQDLGFKYIDRVILREAAKRLGTDEESLAGREERSSSLIEKVLAGFAVGAPLAYGPPLGRPVYDKDLFTVERRIMNDIVDHYSAVIMGRGGFHGLKDRPDIVSVFIHAPMEFRIKRVMDVLHMRDPKKAQAKIRESDRKRTKFVRDVLGLDWTDARNFQLCVDSSVSGFSGSAGIIISLVNEKRRSAVDTHV